MCEIITYITYSSYFFIPNSDVGADRQIVTRTGRPSRMTCALSLGYYMRFLIVVFVLSQLWFNDSYFPYPCCGGSLSGYCKGVIGITNTCDGAPKCYLGVMTLPNPAIGILHGFLSRFPQIIHNFVCFNTGFKFKFRQNFKVLYIIYYFNQV